MIPKVSIVVPMYGVEPFLNKCVDILLAQSLHDIEIILVDDGSPDRCGEIAEEYAIKDNRVKVIHQKNSGLGPARNTGMAAATGEYIGFLIQMIGRTIVCSKDFIMRQKKIMLTLL